MKLSVDLHIHSSLSPCSSKDMTPNNIVNMALLKGLDIIAVTDHNSAANLPGIMKCASGTDLIVVPGIELETSEEVHLVCLFPRLDSALDFGSYVYLSLPDMYNREDIFGKQLIMDENDEVISVENRFLITASGLSLDKVVDAVLAADGVVIPAHIDRDSYSMLSNLGSIPAEYGFRYLEISKKCDLSAFIRKHPELVSFSYLVSSDAHYLGDILEKQSFIELDAKNTACLFKALSGS